MLQLLDLNLLQFFIGSDQQAGRASLADAYMSIVT